MTAARMARPRRCCDGLGVTRSVEDRGLDGLYRSGGEYDLGGRVELERALKTGDGPGHGGGPTGGAPGAGRVAEVDAPMGVGAVHDGADPDPPRLDPVAGGRGD